MSAQLAASGIQNSSICRCVNTEAGRVTIQPPDEAVTLTQCSPP
jgi:hypothetical protein